MSSGQKGPLGREAAIAFTQCVLGKRGTKNAKRHRPRPTNRADK